MIDVLCNIHDKTHQFHTGYVCVRTVNALLFFLNSTTVPKQNIAIHSQAIKPLLDHRGSAQRVNQDNRGLQFLK